MIRRITLLLGCLMLRTIALSQTGFEISQQLAHNTVRIHTLFEDGSDENGFGIIISEREGTLYVATANHVVESGPQGRSIEVSFNEKPGQSFSATYINGNSNDNIDLAVVRIPKPEWLNWSQKCLAEEAKIGDAVWFIGRNKEWYIPSVAEAGAIHSIDPFFDFLINVEIDKVQRGSSGAPAINHLGIFGIILTDQQTSKVISIQKLKQIVQQAWSLPFHLSKYERNLPTSSKAVNWLHPSIDKSSFSFGKQIDLTIVTRGFWEWVDRIEFFVNNVRIGIDTEVREETSGGNLYHYGESYWHPESAGTYNLHAVAYSTDGSAHTSEVVSVSVLKSIDPGGLIVAIEPSRNDTSMFLLNYDLKQVAVLHPPKNKIVKRIELPHQKPVAMQYSPNSNELYIIYQYQGVITALNTNTWVSRTLKFSDTEDGLDLALDEDQDRILVLTQSKVLYSIQVSTGTVQWSQNDFIGDRVVYNSDDQSLFSVLYGQNVMLSSYSVSESHVVPKKSISQVGVNCNDLYLSPDNRFLLLPCGSGNSDQGYEVHQYNSKDITDRIGSFEFGAYPQSICFSGINLMFASNSDFTDDYIYAIDLNTENTDYRFDFPNSDCNAILKTSASNKYLLAFSYNNHPGAESPDHRIFVYDLQHENQD